MFNSTNTPFTMPVMPATGGYADGAGWETGDGYGSSSYSHCFLAGETMDLVTDSEMVAVMQQQ